MESSLRLFVMKVEAVGFWLNGAKGFERRVRSTVPPLPNLAGILWFDWEESFSD